MAQPINNKTPEQCATLAEVRQEIDHIDREIIHLLAERFGYVREVVKYKEGNHNAIEATERWQAVLKSRGAWAAEQGLSAEVVEQMYDLLVRYFIEEEKKIAKL